ncbi:AEC family transporter [Pseudohalioglobus lutimaris]|uniref:AEC family transporter n=1 Tax=Pseudohalioglobus lutimaris TaxID=1737061 RepID=UPI001E622B0A|nr:AEC family transporter [Pseudohalioglobus lutimaris]
MTHADAIELFITCLLVSLPTFAWVFAGALLARMGWLSDQLNDRISRLSFRYGLPLMLFAGAAGVDYSNLLDATYLLAGVLGTLLVVTTSWLYSIWRGHPHRERGIFVQGAYRSNLAIMGLALCISAYGQEGARLAALAVAVMTSLYNVLVVFVLNSTLGGTSSPQAALLGVLRNPLIIGIAAGVALSLSGLPIPAIVEPAGVWLSKLFLPLMLICIGGAMKLGELRNSGALAWESTVWRLLVAPALVVGLAMLLGVRGAPLGVLFLLVGAPAAASGYIMVVAARGNGVLAANIVVLTTLFSALSLTLGLFLLSLLSLVGQIGG